MVCWLGARVQGLNLMVGSFIREHVSAVQSGGVLWGQGRGQQLCLVV